VHLLCFEGHHGKKEQIKQINIDNGVYTMRSLSLNPAAQLRVHADDHACFSITMTVKRRSKVFAIPEHVLHEYRGYKQALGEQRERSKTAEGP
jgi:hypothetical protein